jgi:hypothetical protein
MQFNVMQSVKGPLFCKGYIYECYHKHLQSQERNTQSFDKLATCSVSKFTGRHKLLDGARTGVNLLRKGMSVLKDLYLS